MRLAWRVRPTDYTPDAWAAGFRGYVADLIHGDGRVTTAVAELVRVRAAGQGAGWSWRAVFPGVEARCEAPGSLPDAEAQRKAAALHRRFLSLSPSGAGEVGHAVE